MACVGGLKRRCATLQRSKLQASVADRRLGVSDVLLAERSPWEGIGARSLRPLQPSMRGAWKSVPAQNRIYSFGEIRYDQPRLTVALFPTLHVISKDV